MRKPKAKALPVVIVALALCGALFMAAPFAPDAGMWLPNQLLSQTDQASEGSKLPEDASDDSGFAGDSSATSSQGAEADDANAGEDAGGAAEAAGKTGTGEAAGKTGTGEASAEGAGEGGGSGYEPNVVLVGFTPGVSSSQALEAFSSYGELAGVQLEVEERYYAKLSLPDTLSVERAVELLPETGAVVSAEPNYYLSLAEEGQPQAASPASAQTSDPSDASQAISASSPAGAAASASSSDRAAASASESARPGDGALGSAQVSDVALGSAVISEDILPGIQSMGAPNDPEYGIQWAFGNINALAAWNAVADAVSQRNAADPSFDPALDPATPSDPVVIAVADNGFDLANPDFDIPDKSDTASSDNAFILPYNSSLGRAVSYSDAAYPLPDPDGTKGADHGTHVAGIIAAHTNNGVGVAGTTYNNCKVMPIRLTSSTGSMSAESMIKALTYVKEQQEAGVNIRVVNLSVGMKSRSGGAQDGASRLQKAIDDLHDSGIVVVAAACNQGATFPTIPCEAYPSDLDNVVSVINLTNLTSSADGVVRDSGSNYNLDTQMAKDISAPGYSIRSTSTQERGWYRYKSGTSMAAPFVSGVFGLMFTADPTLSPDEAVSKLYSTARDLTSSAGASVGWDRVTGYGALDAAAAVSNAPYISAPTVIANGSDVPFRVKADGEVVSGQPEQGGETGDETGDETPAGPEQADGPDAGVSGAEQQGDPNAGADILTESEEEFSWSSSDETVATVDVSTGVVTAVGSGEVIVKAQSSSSTVQQTVKVYGIEGADTIPIGLSETYAVAPDSSLTWTWSVTAPNGTETPYATIDATSGLLSTMGFSGTTPPQQVLVTATSATSPDLRAEKTVTIANNELTKENSTVSFGAVTYNGTYLQPVPTVVKDSSTLQYGVHYTVTWSDNLNAGTGKATISGIAPITGSFECEFAINKAPIELADIALNTTAFAYESNSTYKAPVVSYVRDIGMNASTTYVNMRDYTFTATPIALGSSSVIVTATGECANFTGSTSRVFTVTATWQPMYRLYNPNSGEHFYTASAAERNNLTSVGWRYESIGWYAPTTGDNVYRLYNPNAGDHHYTTSAAERTSLIAAGWRNEGVGWKSGGSTVLYREYNPNAKAGAHNYTTNLTEHNYLCSIGWRGEGTAWYGR